ncbi:isopropylmalate isomerase [Thalassobacter stenotrophicus]|nr:isopropylmalate isomerase [Thalassobacter stenotrophicus]UYP68671.1 isopropylmalate isomerase [Thalassobacter stenotrophicus]
MYLSVMTTFMLMDDRARLRERFYGASMSVRARLG